MIHRPYGALFFHHSSAREYLRDLYACGEISNADCPRIVTRKVAVTPALLFHSGHAKAKGDSYLAIRYQIELGS